MKHYMLKFNHGVEIGANLAYMGHYTRTGDSRVLEIANDEISHRETLVILLALHGEKSNIVIDYIFKLIGWSVYLTCQISPKFALNFIAKILEKFAVFNYYKLMNMYPKYSSIFKEMAIKEKEHEEYFNGI